MPPTIRNTWASSRASVDKGQANSGRSRGSEAKPYPVPWSIAPQQAPKFPGSKLKHVSDLDEAEFAAFQAKFPSGLELYEKVDGGVAMLAGVDRDGFWTSKKTGPKRRSVVEYSGPHDAVCREVHLVLAGSRMTMLPEGTFISADILKGARPNTIRYDGKSRIVVHGVYEEMTGRTLESGGDKRDIPLSEGWTLCLRRRIQLETTLTEGNDRALTEATIIASLDGIVSDYGGESVEGLVARDPETGDLVKIVKQGEFSKLNKLYWEYRDRLGKGAGDAGSFKKGIWAELREEFAERVLGTRSVLSPNKSGWRLPRIDPMTSHVAFIECLNSAYERTCQLESEFNSLEENVLPDDVVERTFEAFDLQMQRISDGLDLAKMLGEGSAGHADLVRYFVEGLNYDKTKEDDLKAYVGRMFSPIVKKLNKQSQGMFSDVYLLQSGQVLKITNEESGTDSALRVKGKNLPGIAKVFDVGKMPDKFKSNSPIYYVLLEKLEPLPDDEQDELFDASADVYHLFQPDPPPYGLVSWQELKQYAHEQAKMKGKDQGGVEWCFDVLERNNVPKISETLSKNRIYGLYDFNGGNIMLRGQERVLVDFGSGKTGPTDHKRLGEAVRVLRRVTGSSQREVQEREMESILLEKNFIPEAKGGRAASIGLTVGRFQPFHKDHARLVRTMAARYDKVIIAVAGNKVSKENPFSFDLRKRLMQLSLPDIEPKLEVYEVESGYLPSILEHVAESGSKSYQPGDAVEVVVGDDRFEEFKQQIDRHVSQAESGVDMTTVRVLKAPDGRDGAVSGKQIRDLIASGDIEGAKKLLDPHCLTDKSAIDSIMEEMRSTISGKKDEGKLVREFLTDIAKTKEDGMELIRGLLDDMRDVLMDHGVDLTSAEFLGNGRNGGAWRLSDGHVFKVTTDKAEAQNAIAVCRNRKKLKHIYKVERVFALAQINDVQIFGLIQEGGLEKPSKQERALFEQTVTDLKSGTVDRDAVKLFGIDGIARELKELGIKGDIHSGNILKRDDGSFVLIDLGTAGELPKKVDEDEDQTTARGKSGVHLIGDEAGVKQIIEMNRERLKELGINVGPVLGVGTMGVAFDAGGGKAFKVTVDQSEAASNSVLLGKPLKHVNRVYQIFYFKKVTEEAQTSGFKVYGILSDKLEELTNAEKVDIDMLTDRLWADDVIDVFSTQPWEAVRAALYTSITKPKKASAGSDKESEWTTNNMGNKKVQDRTWNIIDAKLKHYQVPEMVTELRANGVQFADFHSGNVMKRGSDYVVTDLSKSKTPGGNSLSKAHIIEIKAINEIGISAGPSSFNNSAPGTSAWSSGMMARVGTDDTEERDRGFGWRGKKKSTSNGFGPGQQESKQKTRTSKRGPRNS